VDGEGKEKRHGDRNDHAGGTGRKRQRRGGGRNEQSSETGSPTSASKNRTTVAVTLTERGLHEKKEGEASLELFTPRSVLAPRIEEKDLLGTGRKGRWRRPENPNFEQRKRRERGLPQGKQTPKTIDTFRRGRG